MFRPGDTIDIWVVEKALGSGGMGSVYRCHNRSASRILAAVKVLDASLRRYPEAEARFVREAEILFQLDHPNIVRVRNVRTDTDPPYLEMEFVDGEPLEARLERGPIPITEALPLMRQVADAIRYMHQRGIRHRDIKPANVLLRTSNSPVPEVRATVVDFGLAVETDVTRLTAHGMAFGTVSYAPPEWITPERIDPASWDIYALGTLFYEILTGAVAFPVSGEGSARQQAMQVIVAKQGHAPLDPGDAFHDDIRALIGEMTASDPLARTPDMEKVLERLAAVVPTMVRPLQSVATPVSRGRAGETDVRGRRTLRSARPTFLSLPVRTMMLASVGLFGLGGLTLVSALGAGLHWFTPAPPPAPPLAAVAPAPALVSDPLPVVVAPEPDVEASPVQAVTPPPPPIRTEPAVPERSAPPPTKPVYRAGTVVRWTDLGPWLAQNPDRIGKITVKDGPKPATGVTAAVADAFCRAREGLVLGVDDPPLVPTDPDVEFRRQPDGKIVLLEAVTDVPRQVQIGRYEKSTVAAFRCTK